LLQVDSRITGEQKHWCWFLKLLIFANVIYHHHHYHPCGNQAKKCYNFRHSSAPLQINITPLFSRMSTTGETILKTMSDYWVVGKLSNLREFYVVIHQKNANLIEINGKNI